MSDAPAKEPETEEERGKKAAAHLVGVARYYAWRLGANQDDDGECLAAAAGLLRAALARIEGGKAT